jgi:hypothetical protein
MFAVRHKENARQTIYLPCAKIKTHDKLFFYRTLFFTVRHGKCARQSFSLPWARKYAHGKD